MSDAELAARITEANGLVFIGFKNPDAVEGVDDFGRTLASGSSLAAGKAAVRALGITITMEYSIPAVVARMSAELLARLREIPYVEYVEPVVPGKRLSLDTIPWNVERVGAPDVWEQSTGADAVLAIIDSGTEILHPDLTTEFFANCIAGDTTEADDTNGHGTAVAGVAAARLNDVQIAGVAHGVRLWSFKDGNAVPNPAYTACGVQLARESGADVINISSSLVTTTALTDQINAAYNQNGVVVVASAGVSGSGVTYPASLSNVIAVSATDTNDAFLPSSAQGSKVELSAPGTTVANQRGLRTTCLGGITCTSYGGFLVQGTSFSAPHVAAGAALLKAYDPSWSNVEIRYRLGAGAVDLGAAGRDALFGYGRLNVAGAINAPIQVTITGIVNVPAPGQQTWTCTSMGGGGGALTYLWEKRPFGGAFQTVGTSQSYSETVSFNDRPQFTLRCTVTSGGQSASDTHLVAVNF